MNEEQRFFSHVQYSEDDCWQWLSCKNKKGYGKILIKRNGTWKSFLAHRWSYIYFRGHIGSFFCCHHCDNPGCVNPFHLFLGTNKDNMRDMKKKGRAVSPSSFKTHCPHGHEYSIENTYYSNEGRHRKCKTCVKKRVMKYYREVYYYKRKNKYA